MNNKLTPHEQKKQREKAAKAAAWGRFFKELDKAWDWYRWLKPELKEGPKDK